MLIYQVGFRLVDAVAERVDLALFNRSLAGFKYSRRDETHTLYEWTPEAQLQWLSG